MHWVTVRPVCAVGDALGTVVGGPEGGLPLVQRAMVALVPQVVDLVMVLLVMPTRWFVCLSARGVGAGVGRLPVRVVVGAPGAWWAWLGAGARVGVYLVRAAGGLWAAGALLLCVCCLVERGRRVFCVGGVGSGRRGWCRCGCLGLGAGCGRVVRAVWSGVMVVLLATSMVTVLQVVRVGRRCWRFSVWVLWVVWSVGVLQVWCGADGGVPGDGVVSTAGGEGVVGGGVGGGAAGERLVERRGRQCDRARCWVLRCGWSAGGGCGWWCGARCVWPAPGILGVVVGADVLMSAGCPPFCPWSWCRRWVAACVRFVPLCVAVVVGVGALGAWWA